MIKICFLTKYHENGSSSRYRYYNYKKFLDNDINITYSPLLDYAYVENLYSYTYNSIFKIIILYFKRMFFLLKNKEKYDLFIIEKELFPYIPFFIEKILLKKNKYSIDFDDNAKTKYSNNKFIRFVFENKIDNLVKNANFITVGNKWYFSDLHNCNMFFLPTVIDYNKYDLIVSKSEIFQIVWIGSPSTSKYLYIVENALNKLVEQDLKFKFLIIGSGNFCFKHPKFNYELIGWNEETEVQLIAQSHVGIMPLDVTNWEEGKCGFKLIQYLAAGLPVIASNTVANKDIINKGNIGFIANNELDWINYIKYFYDHQDKLFEYSIRAKEIVCKNYCYQVTGKIYSKIIMESCE